MSIEQTPPNLDHTPDNEAVEDRISDDRISDDIDRSPRPYAKYSSRPSNKSKQACRLKTKACATSSPS